PSRPGPCRPGAGQDRDGREALPLDAERGPDGDGETLRRHPPLRPRPRGPADDGRAAADRGGVRGRKPGAQARRLPAALGRFIQGIAPKRRSQLAMTRLWLDQVEAVATYGLYGRNIRPDSGVIQS